MARNPERRTLLADAGLRVLADAGARGLTHRAVDAEAGVPTGTTSNYFPSRAALLAGLAERIFARIAPDPAVLADLGRREPSLALSTATGRHPGAPPPRARGPPRALFERRRAAARRPELRSALGGVLRQGYADDVAHHLAAGLPGGAYEVALLHYAVDGLLLDLLTTSIDAGFDTDQVVSDLVSRLVGGATG